LIQLWRLLPFAQNEVLFEGGDRIAFVISFGCISTREKRHGRGR